MASNLLPVLVIFDIDETLLIPDIYSSIAQISKGLYDNKLLSKILINPNYQVAIASFNNNGTEYNPNYNGFKLARAILDIQHPIGDSRTSVPNDFIQAWIFSNITDIQKYGKNVHLQMIKEAFRQKYKEYPITTVLYDDNLLNVYMARLFGISSKWVSTGLTRDNINIFFTIGDRILFKINNIKLFNKNVYDKYKNYIEIEKYDEHVMTFYLYMPINNACSANLYSKALTEARHGLPQVGDGLALRARDENARVDTSVIYSKFTNLLRQNSISWTTV